MQSGIEKRMYTREPCSDNVRVTVLCMHNFDFKRIQADGKIVDISRGGVGLLTDFPLEPGHVLEWDDNHIIGRLNIALVRWCSEIKDRYRAGLMFI